MVSKRIAVLLALGVFLLSAAAPAQSTGHRVVFGLTSADPADWKLTLGNIGNLLTAAGKGSAQVEVVSYGPGLGFVKKGSAAEAAIVALEARKVRFVACANSMRVEHVVKADLIPGVGVVPAGVLEVVQREEQGWSYIKAGR